MKAASRKTLARASMPPSKLSKLCGRLSVDRLDRLERLDPREDREGEGDTSSSSSSESEGLGARFGAFFCRLGDAKCADVDERRFSLRQRRTRCIEHNRLEWFSFKGKP
jgi:hypothetical protein